MSDNLGTMGETAKALSRNPLGIIALFLVLVYGMAALVLAAAAGGLGGVERVLLVLFLVGFPPAVLWVFRDLVMNHTGKLYSPGDIADEKAAKAARELWKAQADPSRAGMRAAAPADPWRAYSAVRMAAFVAQAAPRVPKLLWVDDRPANNLHERRALEAAGYAVQLATSTDDALAMVGRDRFDTIVSDMGRPEGERAGYDLLEKLRATGNATPFIIYSGSGAPEHRAEAKRRGALDSTNDPNELLELVAGAV